MQPQDIIDFWFSNKGKWFNGGEEFDREIQEKFTEVYSDILAGKYEPWLESLQGTLAYILILDQFPRNMFRGAGQAFENDFRALYTTKIALQKGFLQELPPEQQRFLLMPLMHSESLPDQDMSVSLFREIYPDKTDDKWALEHQSIIKKFGRFPHRNSALKRQSTPEELEFMQTNKGF